MKKQIAITLACLTFASQGRCLTADEIIAKVQTTYAALASFSASGKTVTDIDASAADLTGLPGGAPADPTKTATPSRRKMTSEFSLRLARPELYNLEWSQEIAPGQLNHSAAWSAGEGCFLLMGDKKLLQQTNLDLGLATATGVSMGIANTIPSIFFARPNNLLKLFTSLSQLPDEKIGAENCYVVSGTAAGLKITLWITRAFLVKQKRHTLGGTPVLPQSSDEDVRRGLEAAGLKATPESIEQFKKTAQLMRAASSQMKGSITETYEKIQVNPPLPPKAFTHVIPPTAER